MSRHERNFTKLSEISGGTVEIGRKNKTTRVVFDMHTLPDWINQDEIGVNLPALHRRCRLAGIESIHVSLASGKTTEVNPTIVGRNADSTAILGKRESIKKIPTYDANLSSNDQRHMPLGFRWGHVNLQMNFSEMEQRIRNRNKPVRSSQEWSQEINTALQEGIARKGAEHLIFSMNRLDVTGSVIFAGIGTFSGIISPGVGALPFILLQYMSMNTSYSILNKAVFGSPKPYRWSLFLGPQIDRAGILYVQKEIEQITGRQKLVRALPPVEN